jgi:hypothetical protein
MRPGWDGGMVGGGMVGGGCCHAEWGIYTSAVPFFSTVGEITPFNATIQWVLTDPYNSSEALIFIAFYGVTSRQLNMRTPGEPANLTRQAYCTQLNSLQPGTEYFYRIESIYAFGSVSTKVMNFTTIETSELICSQSIYIIIPVHGV